MPKIEVPVPKMSKYTNESLIIPPNMIDEDNGMPVEAAFHANANLQEGVSGQKSIDTLYENFTQDIVESPRSASNEPIGLPDLDDYPHRRY